MTSLSLDRKTTFVKDLLRNATEYAERAAKLEAEGPAHHRIKAKREENARRHPEIIASMRREAEARMKEATLVMNSKAETWEELKAEAEAQQLTFLGYVCDQAIRITNENR